ncbi:MAG: hypothetical protein ACYSTY_00985 [Planctomycetota bacterium]|jgi:hypothetical protein
MRDDVPSLQETISKPRRVLVRLAGDGHLLDLSSDPQRPGNRPVEVVAETPADEQDAAAVALGRGRHMDPPVKDIALRCSKREVDRSRGRSVRRGATRQEKEQTEGRVEDGWQHGLGMWKRQVCITG